MKLVRLLHNSYTASNTFLHDSHMTFSLKFSLTSETMLLFLTFAAGKFFFYVSIQTLIFTLVFQLFSPHPFIFCCGREWTRTELVIRQKPSLISEKSASLTNIFHSPVGLFVGNTTEISNHSRHDN
jgi:hypothetical protein